jgi:hypothetical protein
MNYNFQLYLLIKALQKYKCIVLSIGDIEELKMIIIN